MCLANCLKEQEPTEKKSPVMQSVPHELCLHYLELNLRLYESQNKSIVR